MKTIKVKTNHRNELVDITDWIEKIVKEEGITQGVCMIFCPHTTAGLTINENADISVKKDILKYLSDIVPEAGGYSHMEGNSDSHIKASILGSSLSVAIEQGRLALGTWQGIYFCEFDGPRQRKTYIKVIKG